jgi:hypothetical protein
MESLLGDLDDLYCCERRQDVIDTRTDVAIALSVEVSAAPGWRVHRLVVTHATCAPSQVRRALDLRDQPVQQAAENQRPGHLLGLRPACGVPSALVMWEITGQLLHWPAPRASARRSWMRPSRSFTRRDCWPSTARHS